MKTLLVTEKLDRIEIVLNRPFSNNSINLQLLKELNALFNELETKDSPPILVIKGQNNFFCTGMDLKEVAFSKDKETWAHLFVDTLERFTKSSKVIISIVEGKVTAGGVGLMAASDFIFVTKDSTFKLTELLLGLIPAMIAPFIINRIGMPKFRYLALSSKTLEAAEAHSIGLIDFFDENPDALINQINRIEPKTLKEFKCFFSLEDNLGKKKAVQTIINLLDDPKVQSSIRLVLQKMK